MYKELFEEISFFIPLIFKVDIYMCFLIHRVRNTNVGSIITHDTYKMQIKKHNSKSLDEISRCTGAIHTIKITQIY